MGAAEKIGPAAVSLRRRKTVALANTILDVLATFDGSMSTRQVFYQCVSRGAVPNSQREYDRVQRLLVEMRRRGEVPQTRIVDRTRRRHQRGCWDGVGEILSAVAVQYRRDVWSDQPTVVMVACEKQALEGIFAEEVDRYGASLWVIRGYISESFAYEWSAEINEVVASGHTVRIVYFGDHDPSGLNISHTLRRQFARFEAPCEFHRAGLLFEDIERFNIPPLDVKTKDSRAQEYLREFGNVGAELDALPPDVLRRRIRDSIEPYIDSERWERVTAAEHAERESLNLIASNWDAALAGVRAANDRSDP